ncbi:MAG: hypothetical protein R3E39_15360 [Anaerolineae bacterium]
MADNTPNFDAMSPEEIMAWMESLAKRQGADEGFTTAANVDIAEIDPDSVVIDEPGYIPPEGSKAAKQAQSAPVPAPKPVPAKPAASAPPPAAVKPAEPAQQPSAPPPAPAPAAAQLPIFDEPAPVMPDAEAPDWLSSLGDEVKTLPKADEPPAAEPTGLSWLESLAVDSGAAMGEIDLSSLGAELPPLEPEPAAANPIDWLESLAQSESAEPAPAEIEDPVNWLDSLAQGQGVVEPPVKNDAVPASDPMNWLESLARGQGARAEEFTTAADLDIPPQESAEALTPGYTEYNYETPGMAAKSEPPASKAVMAQDPSAWLDSLASQTFESSKPAAPPPADDKPMSDNEIQQALKRGDLVPSDQMEAWMQRQLQEGAQREEPEELAGDYDPDAPPVKAELPDWLLEQVGTPAPFDEPEEVMPPQTPALIETILEPPPVDNIPDWLKDEEPAMDELDSIFATPQEEWTPASGSAAEEPAAASGVVLDANDPWVEALEMEYKEKSGEAPEPVVAQVITPAAAPPASEPIAAALQDAALPAETELPAGIPDAVPDWLSSVTGEQEVVAEPEIEAEMPDWLSSDITESQPAPAVASEVPDWLADVDIEPAEIPDWLKQSITTTSDSPAVITPSSPAPATVPATIVPVRASPAPVPVSAQKIDVAAVLQAARQFQTSNDIAGSLGSYEQLIRANAQLDDVVDDLAKMADKFKTSAAVHRVLGDGLMRQGKLQAALDTYRKALNQL